PLSAAHGCTRYLQRSVGMVGRRVQGRHQARAIRPPQLAVGTGCSRAQLIEELVGRVQGDGNRTPLREADEVAIHVASLAHAAPDVALGDDCMANAPVARRALEAPRQVPKRFVSVKAQKNANAFHRSRIHCKCSASRVSTTRAGSGGWDAAGAARAGGFGGGGAGAIVVLMGLHKSAGARGFTGKPDRLPSTLAARRWAMPRRSLPWPVCSLEPACSRSSAILAA